MKYSLLLLVLSFELHAQSEEWKTLDNAAYAIEYPSTWEVNQSGMAGTKFILLSPLAAGRSFRDNINFLTQDLKDQPMTIDEFTKFSTDQISQLVTNANIIETKKITSGGIPKYEVIYTGNQGKFAFKWKQHYWIVNDMAYVLTFTAEQTTYDEQVKLADRIMNSFKSK